MPELPTITVYDLLQFRPCYKDQRLQNLIQCAKSRTAWNAIDILECDQFPLVDRLWLIDRPQLISNRARGVSCCRIFYWMLLHESAIGNYLPDCFWSAVESCNAYLSGLIDQLKLPFDLIDEQVELFVQKMKSSPPASAEFSAAVKNLRIVRAVADFLHVQVDMDEALRQVPSFYYPTMATCYLVAVAQAEQNCYIESYKKYGSSRLSDSERLALSDEFCKQRQSVQTPVMNIIRQVIEEGNNA